MPRLSRGPPRVQADIHISDKATKRVIAPFVRIVRKGLKPTEVEEATQFSFYLQKKPSVLIRDLSSFLSDSVDLPSLLHETADVLKNVTKAAGVTLYMMDPATQEIYHSRKTSLPDRYKIKWKIREGTTTAAYVAYWKNHVLVEDIMADGRFPEGIGYQSDQIKSVLCVPVVTPDGECFAVIELFRMLFDHPFSQDDLKIALIVTGWMGAAIHQNAKRLALQRQQELNDYLLDLTKCFFGESVVMEKMISEIIKFAKVTLNAERGTIFIIDRDSGEDLVADLFEDSEETAYKKPQKVRFAKERGIAGVVARTGITVNVRDAYNDTRFNKEIDQKTGFITRSILCMPIMGVEGIMGVVQVVNKKTGGSFTSTDEHLFRTFCVYCALALRYTKAQQQMNATQRLNNIFLKMLQLQLPPCSHDINFCVNNPRITVPLSFDQFSWYINLDEHKYMPQMCLYIFFQLIDKKELHTDLTLQYILSVRKFYRRTPYHNFEHGFNVCHCMFIMLKRNIHIFTPLEVKALVLGALSHSVDHGGFTNHFLELTNDDLSFLYENSLLENHNYYVAMLILDNYKIFKNITAEEYALLRNEIKLAILATDLQVCFARNTVIERICKNNEFDWTNEAHRTLVKGLMMSAADFSGMCKPFLVTKKITDSLYTEFYRQGDLEKELDLCPLPLMDREKHHLIPEDRVCFMNIVVIPSMELLKQLLPSIRPLYNEAKFLAETWQAIIDVRGKKCWRQDDSIVEKRYKYHY